MGRRKGPSARDLAEIRSGTASARDRAEAGAHKATRGKHAKKMSNRPKRKGGRKKG
jgi:hypothetical protein